MLKYLVRGMEMEGLLQTQIATCFKESESLYPIDGLRLPHLESKLWLLQQNLPSLSWLLKKTF